MDDFSDLLIYVLLIAASIVGGIYKNYTKKKEEEERRQSQVRNVNNSDSEEEYIDPRAENKSIPSTLEDFLKKQFEIETEALPADDEIVLEKDYTINEPLDIPYKEEGVAAFKNTNKTLLPNNLNVSNFSIASEFNTQFNIASVSEEEKSAFRIASISEDEESAFRIAEENESEYESFDLHQAVVFSEILKRPYQE